jgi:hypothetical protein
MWIWPWFGGMTLIGYLGRYGGNNTLPDWWDLAVVIVFSLIIFYWAVSLPNGHRSGPSCGLGRAAAT